MSRIVCLEGPDKGLSCEFAGDTLVIGSAQGIGCILKDAAVSPRHAMLSLDAGKVELSRTASGGEIYLNGAKSCGAILKNGDLIKLGSTVLRFEDDGPAPKQSSAVVFSKGVEAAADDLPLPEPGMPERERAELTQRHAALGRTKNLAGNVQNLEQLAAAVVDLALPLLPSARVCVAFESGDGDFPPLASKSSLQEGQAQLTPSRAITHAALRNKTVVITLDASQDGRFKDSQSVMIQRLSSALCAPILVRDSARGFIYAERDRETFSAADASFCAAVAGQTGLLAANLPFAWKENYVPKHQPDASRARTVVVNPWFLAAALFLLLLLLIM